MAYAAWSVTAGEVPTSTKWNILGTNDAGFNDGTNIAAGAINNTHIAAAALVASKFNNPYKFSAYRNAAYTLVNTGFVKVPFETKDFDTNSNFDIVTNVGRYTAAVAGFYYFSFNVGSTVGNGSTDSVSAIYKNGTIYSWGQESSASGGMVGGKFLSLAISDYVEVYGALTTNNAINVGGSPRKTYFDGFLVSAT